MAPKRKAPDATAVATPAGKRAKGKEETPPKAAAAAAGQDKLPELPLAFGKAMKSGEVELSLDSPDSGEGKAAKAKAKGKAKAKAKAKANAKAAGAEEAGAEAGAKEAGGPMKPKEIAALIEASTPYSASLRPAPAPSPKLKVLSWNVNGLNALLKARPDALKELLEAEKPDVLMLQETKLQAKDVGEAQAKCGLPQGWGCAWACSTRTLGYSGVAALWRPGLEASVVEGAGLPEADEEGRCLTLETPDHFVVGCYVPNAGDGLKRLDFRVGQWEPAIAAHVRKLQEKKPVVYCGDLNVCHKELDLWGNHSPNAKQAGYTPQERQAMSGLLEGCGLTDSFRLRHPNVRGFSYWSYRFNGRAKNNGWRLDYCLVSKALERGVHDAFVLPDVMGSDHCPVGVTLV